MFSIKDILKCPKTFERLRRISQQSLWLEISTCKIYVKQYWGTDVGKVMETAEAAQEEKQRLQTDPSLWLDWDQWLLV